MVGGWAECLVVAECMGRWMAFVAFSCSALDCSMLRDGSASACARPAMRCLRAMPVQSRMAGLPPSRPPTSPSSIQLLINSRTVRVL